MPAVRRLLLFATATMTAGSAALLATAQPAAASAEPVQLTPATWAWTDSANPKTAYVNKPGNAPVGTIVDSAGAAHTSRSYFTFDLKSFKAQTVQYSLLVAYESVVNDCSAKAPIEIWRTAPVKANTTWKNPPAELELLTARNLGSGSYACPVNIGVLFTSVVADAVARGDKSLTVEYRVARASEGDQHFGRTITTPGLTVTGNHPPKLTDLKLLYPDASCGTLAKNPKAKAFSTVGGTVVEPDPRDYVRVTAALWPADHPDQRREFSGSVYNGAFQAGIDLSAYNDGTVIAWTARAYDDNDTGPWGKTCYLTVDKTAPANAPTVFSKTYPGGEVQSGGPSVAGKFRLDAGGDHDVAGFAWRSWLGGSGIVKANRAGQGVYEFTPNRAGPQILYFAAVDAAGNRGPEKEYQFFVRATAPYGNVDVAGVGLPSTITLDAPTGLGITQMSYQPAGAAEVKLPVVNGKATGQITFAQTGYFDIALRSYKGTKLIGQESLQVSVSDEPVVESAEFDPFTAQEEGKTGAFTFKPRRAGVVAYEYRIGEENKRVDAGPDGRAVVPYTADNPGFVTMSVVSISADGARSQGTFYSFDIIAVRPVAYTNELNDWPRRDGVGVPLRIQLESYVPDLTGFVYSFAGGPETTVSNDGNWYALIDVVPPHAGDNTLVAWALRGDGSRSPSATYTFNIWSGPVVTWNPPGDAVVGHPVTVTFRSAQPGATQFRYHFLGVEDGSVPVGPDGTATVTYNPITSGLDTMYVKSVLADGTESDERQQYISVRDNKVSLYAPWSESYPTGGAGTPGWVRLYSQLDPVEYRYRLDDGPTISVPAPVEYIEITPAHSGPNVLYVQQVLANGEVSPATEYRFLVGTATNVVSSQYPRDTWGGGVGVPGTFELTAGADGVVSFDYQFDSGATEHVAATSGHASVTWTPTSTVTHYLVVTGRRADGSSTDQTTYYFYVS